MYSGSKMMRSIRISKRLGSIIFHTQDACSILKPWTINLIIWAAKGYIINKIKLCKNKSEIAKKHKGNNIDLCYRFQFSISLFSLFWWLFKACPYRIPISPLRNDYAFLNDKSLLLNRLWSQRHETESFTFKENL